MIISPFNPVFFGLLFLAIAGIVLVSLIFRNRSEKSKSIFLLTFCALNIVFFVFYKCFLSIDKEYLIAENLDKFNWFNELPLHLCNINMFLIPIGVLKKSKPLLGFSFYLAPLGAFMALIFPESTFCGYPLFMPRILGFYFTHIMIIMSGILIATLGFYRPKFKDLPAITLTFILIAFGAHLINTLLRHTVCSYANYFFTYDTSGISLLNLFRKLINIPFLYELPAILILLTYAGIISLVFKISDIVKLKNKN